MWELCRVPNVVCAWFLWATFAISSGGFNSRYHPTRVHLGLPDSVIDTINEYGVGGVNFCFNSCRLKGEVVVMDHSHHKQCR